MPTKIIQTGTCVDCSLEVVLTEQGACTTCGSNSIVKRGAIRELEALIETKERERELSPKGVVHTCMTDLNSCMDSLRFAYDEKDDNAMIYHLGQYLNRVSYVTEKVRNVINELKGIENVSKEK